MTDARPLPLADADTRPYWDAAARGTLVMQRCASCRHWRFPPRPMCPRCRSFEHEWAPVSGRGTVVSFVVVHGPVLPAFADRVPYAVALIELEEDPQLRVVGNVLDAAPAELRIGGAVRVAFEATEAGFALPQWRRSA